MDREDKKLAEAVLRHLLVGCRVCGINLCWTPVLTFMSEEPGRRESTLHVKSRWQIFHTQHYNPPASEEEMEELPIEYLVIELAG